MMSNRRKGYIWRVRCGMWLATALTAGVTVFIVGYVLIQGVPNLSWELVSTEPSLQRCCW